MELWRSKMSSEHVRFVRVIFSLGSKVQSITFKKRLRSLWSSLVISDVGTVTVSSNMYLAFKVTKVNIQEPMSENCS